MRTRRTDLAWRSGPRPLPHSTHMYSTYASTPFLLQMSPAVAWRYTVVDRRCPRRTLHICQQPPILPTRPCSQTCSRSTCCCRSDHSDPHSLHHLVRHHSPRTCRCRCTHCTDPRRQRLPTRPCSRSCSRSTCCCRKSHTCRSCCCRVGRVHNQDMRCLFRCTRHMNRTSSCRPLSQSNRT